MKGSSIYIITAITYMNFYDDEHPLGSCRCIGWFPTFEEAEYAIQHQESSLHPEVLWFVIEETTPAFYAQIISRTCYLWDINVHNYVQVAEPEYLKDYPNLGLK